MKKLIIVIGALLIVGCLYFIVQRSSSNKKLDGLNIDDQVAMILESNNCSSCHAKDAKLPFYASFPIAKGIIAKDVEIGIKNYNIEYLLANTKSPSVVSLSMMEGAIGEETMPPLKYSIVHWASALSSKEREIVLQWVKEHRLAKYSTGLNAEEFAAEPVQALVSSIPTDAAKVALGEKLFNDVRLSKDNTVSCATCHSLDSAGTDRLQFSKGIYGQIGGINAPTVFNAAFHIEQFWDGRAADLQAQAGGPPFDALEMGNSSWDEVIVKLKKDRAFTKEFKAVYPEGYTGDNITDAIAEYEKTLITPDSRFDQYLKGDLKALTAEEIEGYELFKENMCATCHVGEVLGAKSYEYMGIFANYLEDREMKADREIIQIKDQGRFNATQNKADLQYFKVPSLRNVALTAPYFHDGTVASLEEATELMFKYETAYKPTPEKVEKIVAFMKTLTGKFNGEYLK